MAALLLKAIYHTAKCSHQKGPFLVTTSARGMRMAGLCTFLKAAEFGFLHRVGRDRKDIGDVAAPWITI